MNRKYLKYGMYAVGGLAAVIIGAKLLHGGNAAASTGATGSTDLGSTLGIPFSSGDIAAGAGGSGTATGSASDAAVQAEIQALLGQLNNPTAPAAGQDALSLFQTFFSKIGPGIGTQYSSGHATFTVNGVPESFDFQLTPITTPAVTPTPTTPPPGGSPGGTGNPTGNPATGNLVGNAHMNLSNGAGGKGPTGNGAAQAAADAAARNTAQSPSLRGSLGLALAAASGTGIMTAAAKEALAALGIIGSGPFDVAGPTLSTAEQAAIASATAGLPPNAPTVTVMNAIDNAIQTARSGNMVGNSVGGHAGGNVQHGGDKMGDNHGQFGGADVSGHDTGNVGGGNGPGGGAFGGGGGGPSLSGGR